MDFSRLIERKRAIEILKQQFSQSFIPETNRERALVSMLEDQKNIIRNLRNKLEQNYDD